MTPHDDAARAAPQPVRARLATAQGDPPIGAERIVAYHPDGSTEELTLHDYARVYALPGVYEQIVQEALGCRSPERVAQLLGAALDELGRPRGASPVIDIAAGNGVSGEALAATGIGPLVLGTDIVPEARAAALRDRPGTYGEYLTRDLLALTGAQRAHIESLRATAVTCVAPVGHVPGQVPPDALAAVVSLLSDEPGHDALVVALHDPRHGEPDALTEEFWRGAVPPLTGAQRMAHERYLHRFTVTGGPYEMEASVWRLRR